MHPSNLREARDAKFGGLAMNMRKKSSLTWMFGVLVLLANLLLHAGVAYAQFGSASVLEIGRASCRERVFNWV